MFAQYVLGFMILKLATPIAASHQEHHLRIFPRIGLAQFAE